jgi:hypothetical protein
VLLLAWVQFADRVTLVAADLPLVLVCMVTLMRHRRGAGGHGRVVAGEIPAAAVRANFGRPAPVYRFDWFTVDVWDVNLLTKMGG